MGKRALLILLVAVALPADTTAEAKNLHDRRAALLAEQLALWGSPAALASARHSLRVDNPEWDFMWRTFTVLTLANLALEDPRQQTRNLDLIDRIIAETLRDEATHGQAHFLLDYLHEKPFLAPGGRSMFVDGEIAVMLGARRLVAEDPKWRQKMSERLGILVRELRGSPRLVAESYPDEVWLFCNSFALVALRMGEVLDGQDHSELLRDWVASARRHLVEPKTGLLVSATTWNGMWVAGPEGSSIWLVASNLALIDRSLAQDQYRRAKTELAGSFMGYAFAREWPESWPGGVDIDSGPIVPAVAASPSSSGFAILAANTFGDDAYLGDLTDALGVAETVLAVDPLLAEMADNPLGDAVILYGLSVGPLWRRMQ